MAPTLATLSTVCLFLVLAPGGRPAPLSASPASTAPRPRAPIADQAADTTPDPERLLDEARSRQRAFERHRRRRLPYMGGRGGGRCDEIVGRYCLWHEDDEDRDREPPEEPESVRQARERLLRHLAGALEAVPDSDWLAGQRVRYLLEAGRLDEALAQASDCAAARWWCRALEGRVLHERGDVVDAERAFAAALEQMDPERRRRWADVSVLLEGEARDRWEALDDAGRERLARRLWHLADPLYLVPGNDRRTEHLARRVSVRMREEAATPFSAYWDDALAELTLRYGVPFAFGREPPRPGRIETRPPVVGRHHPDALRWLPSPEALLDPARAGPDGWELGDPKPRSEHATPYADTTGRLDHWLTVFPRGDSTVVVTAHRWSMPPAATGSTEESLLRLVPVAALDTADGELPATDDRWAGGTRSGLAVRVPSRPHLLSLELLRRDARRAERARYGLPLERRPETLPGLSDLLVLEAGDAVPPTLEAALPRARGPGPVDPGRRLGLYWELYGPRRLMEEVEVTLTLAERGGNVLQRLGRALGIGDGKVVALGWRDRVGEAKRVHPRSVHLRLPEDLQEGEYHLELSVRVPGYETMTAGRDLMVGETEPR